jgi:uncharacterized membrane protein YhaH (DUF805 family)
MFEGKMTRLPYFMSILAVAVVSFIIQSLALDRYGDPTGFYPFSLLLGLGLVVVQASCVVKRLRDLGRPPVHYFLGFIPLYNIYFALILLFQEGAPENR